MALQGTYTKYSYTDHPTEVTSETITYGMGLHEGDANYEKRGTSETIYVPVQIESTEIFENVYLNIKSISTFYHFNVVDNLPNKSTSVNIQYWIYKDKDIYDTDPENIENVLEKRDDLGLNFSTEQLGNVFSSSYAYINSIQGFDQLTNI